MENKDIRDTTITFVVNAEEYKRIEEMKKKFPFVSMGELIRQCITIAAPVILRDGLPQA